jgi:hypothetical protein
VPDEVCTPQDALHVIRYLNAVAADAEGEAASRSSALFLPDEFENLLTEFAVLALKHNPARAESRCV